jgi:hypothetical protein
MCLGQYFAQAELKGLKEARFPAYFSKESHQPAFPCSSSPSPASGGNSQTAAPTNKLSSRQIVLDETGSSTEFQRELVAPILKLNQE